MSKGLKLSEILVTVLIAVIFAIIYNLMYLPYNVVQALGFHLEQLTYGIWFMAAVVAYLIIPKPGIALIAELLVQVKLLLKVNLVFLQLFTLFYKALACEVVFAIFKYKSRSLMVAMLAGFAAAVISLPVDFYYGYMKEVASWNLILFIVFRIISGIVLSGILSYYIVKALDQTGVTKLFRPASQKDYDNL